MREVGAWVVGQLPPAVLGHGSSIEPQKQSLVKGKVTTSRMNDDGRSPECNTNVKTAFHSRISSIPSSSGNIRAKHRMIKFDFRLLRSTTEILKPRDRVNSALLVAFEYS